MVERLMPAGAAEDDLDSEARFRSLVDAIADCGIFMLDPRGLVATWNRGAEQLQQYSASEIVGEHVSKFYRSEDAGKCEEELAWAEAAGRFELEGWRVRKDGSSFWANVVTTALRDEHDELIGFGQIVRDFTKHRTALESVRECEERLRLLVETVEDYAVVGLDESGRVRHWNARAERIKGYGADEVIGRHFSVFYPEEERLAGSADRVLADAAREGRTESEGWRVRKDGTRFWANLVVNAVRSSEGKLIGFVSVTRDLTERRRAEHERMRLEQESAAREVAENLQAYLSTMLHSIGDAVIATDAQARVALMNDVAENMTGWDEGEALGRPLREIFRTINERTRVPERNPAEGVLETGGAIGLAGQGILIGRDGREMAIEDTCAPIRSEDGSTTGTILVFRDVTEKKKGEAQRSFLEEVMATLSASLDYHASLARVAELAVPRLADWCTVDMVVEGDEGASRSLAVAHVDPAKVQLARELKQKYPTDPGAPNGLANVLRTGRPELYPEIPEKLLRQVCADAEHLRMAKSIGLRSALIVPLVARDRVLGAITLAHAESGRNYGEDDLDFAMDLAHRCAVAVENARLYAAEQSARQSADVANRAKDEFLATVSHELRTPLTAIMGWAKMMSSASLDGAKRARAVETIDRNAVAMAQLIEDLLDVSRVIGGKMRLDVQAVDLGRIVETAIESVRPSADARGVCIAARLDPAASAFFGDPSRLQQIAWNLLSNAVKFTPADGRVEVVLRSLGTWVELRVTDSGKGIEPHFLPHVFDPFRQEQAGPARTKGGLGLGLAITKHLIELHGGSVIAESDGPGRGSMFTATLPVAAMAGVRAVESAGRPRTTPFDSHFERPSSLRDLRVLVVDDEEDARHLIKAVLEECDSRVSIAPSVEAAMQLFDEGFDVLVSDIGMPEHDGYELIRRVRALPAAQGGSIPAVALTAYTRADDRRRILNAGYSMHVSKPVEPAELVAVLASLVRLMPPQTMDLPA